MYNLHPGLITEYPELKGKDPQARVNSEDHDHVGVVIHKVTPGVDEGEVLLVCSEANVYSDTNAVTEQLHKMASDTWSVFFTDYLLANDTQL
jgi:folate-dependent phosphoribosylglycinamide formyltransferase PurN